MKKQRQGKQARRLEDIITTLPGVRGGGPMIRGSRVSVTDVVEAARIHAEILGLLLKGVSSPPPVSLLRDEPARSRLTKRLAEQWPFLKEADILAAWAYYAEHHEEIVRMLEEEADARQLAGKLYPGATS